MPESTKFTFEDEEFLLMVNAIMARETPLNQEYVPIVSMDENFALDRLDSLGMILFFVWLAELFQLDDDEINIFVAAEDYTVTALKVFVLEQGGKSYTMEEAQELAKRCMQLI